MTAIGRQLRNELEGFILPVLEDTGKLLGRGAYGEVIEMKLNGETVAVKKIHDILNDPRADGNFVVRKFKEECVR